MIVYMFLYSRYEFRWTLTIITLLLLGIALLLNKLTGGIIYRYCDKLKSKTTSNILLGIQWTASILFAFILPNNYLIDFNLFNNLFENNELWIPVTMGFILYASLATLGLLFDLVINVNKK